MLTATEIAGLPVKTGLAGAAYIPQISHLIRPAVSWHGLLRYGSLHPF